MECVFYLLDDSNKPVVLLCSVNVQVPNGHEEDELADGEVMNYMCRDDEVNQTYK